MTIRCPRCGYVAAAHQFSEEPMTLSNTEEHLPLETRDSGLSFAEQRTFEATEIRVEKGADGKTHVVGYAAVFNSRSKPLKTKTGKTFVEQIKPGAFKRTLDSGRDVVMFYNHDPHRVMARTSSKTLKLAEDARGLKFDAEVPDTTAAQDMVKDIEHGNVRGVSFGFSDPQDEWSMDGDTPVRTLVDIPLGEVSPTPFPAYPATEVSVRAIDVAIDRVAAGEKDVRGSYQPDHRDLHDMVNNCRSMCRMATEHAHQTLRAMQQHGDPDSADEHLMTAVRDLHSSMGECRSKMAECRSEMMDQWLDDDGDEGNGPGGDPDDDDPGSMDSTRTMTRDRLEVERLLAIEEQLPTENIRQAMAQQETRAGEAVNTACATRARKAIAEGKVDNGEWEAPNQGDREDADCLGAGKSYPIFKGDKVSAAALRNAASRGAQNAPAVGKAASALLALINDKKD